MFPLGTLHKIFSRRREMIINEITFISLQLEFEYSISDLLFRHNTTRPSTAHGLEYGRCRL